MTNHIHLNPLRAKVVKDLKDLGKYRWCGHSMLMGKTEAGFQDIECVLNLFGRSEKAARRAYESFVAQGVKHGRRPDLVGGCLLRSIGGWAELKAFRDLGIRIKGDERLLGSSDFVERVSAELESRLGNGSQENLRRISRLRGGRIESEEKTPDRENQDYFCAPIPSRGN